MSAAVVRMTTGPASSSLALRVTPLPIDAARGRDRVRLGLLIRRGARLVIVEAAVREVQRNGGAEHEQRVTAGEDPVLAMREILLSNFLAGNDNFAADSTAAFEYEILEDGDYLLLGLGALTNETEGEYELVVGLNVPEVLAGEGRSTGDELAFLDREASGIATAVQEIWGELTAEQHSWFYTIPQIDSEDTLYAFVETTSGDLAPVLEHCPQPETAAWAVYPRSRFLSQRTRAFIDKHKNQDKPFFLFFSSSEPLILSSLTP